MQKALRDIIRKHAIISKNISFVPMSSLPKNFTPSRIKDGKQWIHQEVHIVFKNGMLLSDVCKHDVFIAGKSESFEQGRCIGEVLKNKYNVDKVIITITGGKEEREMIVYSRDFD